MNPMNRKCAPIGLALLCSATLMAGGAGAAQPGSATPGDLKEIDTVSVHYHNTDLAKADGAQNLYRRIQNAARRVCHQPDIRELTLYAEYEKCYEVAVNAAVAKVDVSELTALHRSRTQRTASG
jgi:UrcA family protein